MINSFKSQNKKLNEPLTKQVKSIYYAKDPPGLKYKNKIETPEQVTREQTCSQNKLGRHRSEKDLHSKIDTKQVQSRVGGQLSSQKYPAKVKTQQNKNIVLSTNIHKRNDKQLKNFEQKNLNDQLFQIQNKIADMRKQLIQKRQEKKKIIRDQEIQRERRHKERQNKNIRQENNRNQSEKQKIKISQTQRQIKLSQKQFLRSHQHSNKQTYLKQSKYTNQIQLKESKFVKQASIKKTHNMKQSVAQKSPQKRQISGMHLSLKQFVTQVPQQNQVHRFNTSPYSPRSSIYYVSQVLKAYKDEKSLAKQHIVQSLHYLKVLQSSKMPLMSQVEKRKLNLERRNHYKNKKVLIFDLDETLIHCNDSISKKHDIKITINFPNNQKIEAGVNIRAGAKQILSKFYKDFQIMVFTASHSTYANEVIKLLDPQQKYIQHRLYRQHCYLSPEGMYIKDLRIINRPMADMILVDNAAYSYNFQLDNGVPILPFYHGQDFELTQIQNYLQNMLLIDDIRGQNRKTFKLHEYRSYYNQPNKLVEDLYLNE